MKDNGIGSYAGVIANGYVAKKLGSRADQHIITDGRMSLGIFGVSSASQSHTVINGAVVSDDRGLADNDARTVVDKQAFAYLCTGMDLNAGTMSSALGDPARKTTPFYLVKKMTDPVVNESMKTGV